MNLIVVFIVIVTSVWVLIDAKNIGVKKGQITGLLNLGPWGWFICSLLLWIISFPCYLIKRIQYKKINGKEGGSAVATAIGFFLVAVQICAIVLSFISSATQTTGTDSIASQDPAHKTPANRTFTFNKDDKNVVINGNLPVAIEMHDWMAEKGAKPDLSALDGDLADISSITRKPYSAIGKIFKVRGKVYKIEELPPSASRSKTAWSEFLLLVKNPNSRGGATTVNFIYNGDTTSIKNNATLEIAGYFIGTYESTNAFGGQVEGLTFVGNVARPFTKR